MEAAVRDGYGTGLIKIGIDRNVVVLDGDLSDSTRSEKFQEKYPERFFNMGISEADLVCTAAGLASCGKIAFASSFAGFLVGRAYDQILVSVAYPSLNVKLVGSHAGIATGEDGPTAQSIVDIAVMRALPNMTVIVPADAVECEKSVEEIYKHKGPVYLRMTRPKTPVIFNSDYKFHIGKAVKIREGKDLTIISTGIMLQEVMKAAEMLDREKISAEIIHMPTIKPIDNEAILKSAKKTGFVITCEDHSIMGGLGGAVAEILSESSPTKMLRIGLSGFAESGPYKELYKKYGLDAESIAGKIKTSLK
jgi:transketolase